MVNFRYHIISIVAVFLALGIGVVMGSAVIDQTVVDSLKEQQGRINERVDQVVVENGDLRATLADSRSRSDQLAEEGSERLLAGSLEGVPVLLLAVRGAESDGLEDLVTLLGTAGADYQGTLWFTGRLALATDDDRRELARVLGRSDDAPAAGLRGAAIEAFSAALVASASPGSAPAPNIPPDGQAPTTGTTTGSDANTGASPGTGVIAELREAGFVDYDAPDGAPEGIAGVVAPGTRVVLASGPTASVADTIWAQPLAKALVGRGSGPARIPVLAVEAFAAGDDQRAEFIERLRGDDTLSSRLSTVNDIDDFSGRLAAVLALQDLASGRVGHYGRGTRLIPAPAG